MTFSNAELEALADEWGWHVNAVAFALGRHGGNVADAKAELAQLADEMDEEN